MVSRILFTLAAALLCLLTGCAQQGVISPPEANTPSDPSQLLHWQISGKLGLRHPEKSGSANLLWTQRHDDIDIRLSGPLGSGSTRIQSHNGNYTLQSGNSLSEAADSPEALMLSQVGWSLPVSELPYWIKGTPSPNHPITALTRDQQGHLQHLQQQGWQIDYSRYHPANPIALPAKITLKRSDIKATLIIGQWNLQP